MPRSLISIVLFAVPMICSISCEEKKATEPAAGARTGTAMPAREPDPRTAAAILDKQAPRSGSSSSSASLPPGHPSVGMEPVNKPESSLPPGHPPMGDSSSSKMQTELPKGHPGGGDGPPPEAPQGSLKFTAPATWKEMPVTSSMRKAQFTLPKSGGDSDDGQLIVFYFGKGQGGSTERNIERWQNMFTTADGKPVGNDAVKRRSMEVSGMKVTIIDVTGRFTDAPMGRPVTGPTAQDYRMLAAVVETDEGPWFFKAVGPTGTMVSHATEFDDFVKSVHK